jgi:CheY-like chemotaxis protein
MVVSEQPSFREEVARLIEDQGLESYPAADGIDALRQIYHVRPKLIVSDAGLSRVSGFEFLPFVRRRFPRVAVIAVGTADSAYQEQAPVADLLVPRDPWNAERFIGQVRQMLSQGPVRVREESGCA